MWLIFILLLLSPGPVPAMLISNVPQPPPILSPFAFRAQPFVRPPPRPIPSTRSNHFVESPNTAFESCNKKVQQAKDFDLLLYGVTGFTGGLAAQYLQNYSDKYMYWAIGGRDKKKLDSVRRQLAASKPQPSESLVFGLKNETRLLKMVSRARAIVNFAGPYALNGAEALIQAALKTCTHYVDIATETGWKAEMLKKYARMAEARGVALVQSSGFASLASDFLAMSAIEDVVEVQKSPPSHVMVVWSKFNDAVSGGQIAATTSELKRGLNLDSYILAPDTSDNQKVDWKVDGMDDFGYHNGLGKLVESALAPMDCPVIRRSIHLQYPNATISVQQAANSTLDTAVMNFLNNHTMLAVNPPVQSNPEPGEGPPPWVQRHGSFTGLAIASGSWSQGKGKMGFHKARVLLEGHGDPSFMGSVRMATEVALVLAREGPAGFKGGYLTPSVAVGTRRLEQRLKSVDGGQFMTITHE